MKHLFLFLLLLLQCAPQEKTPLQSACYWLWSQQAADGGWHSNTHGILQGGLAYSPYILYTLLQVPESRYHHPEGQKKLALNFIRKSIGENGRVGESGAEILEYPNYATSYALRVLVLENDPEDAEIIRKMQGYLLKEQFNENRGINPGQMVYGAWGFGEQLAPGSFGHVDLSHTRRVLQALAESGADTGQYASKTQVFLRLVQKRPEEARPQPPLEEPQAVPYDGGFYSSPVVWGSNKAGLSDDSVKYFPSYATATADGLLALLASGVSPHDARVQDALQWLRKHDDLTQPGGIPTNNPAKWNLVLRLYHLCSRAEVYKALYMPAEEMALALEVLEQFRQPDGSYSNPMGAGNKEDDPLLATALAIHVLDLLSFLTKS